MELILEPAITNYIFKVSIEAAVTPLTYWIVKALKKAEGVEIFDNDTSFSPFKFN